MIIPSAANTAPGNPLPRESKLRPASEDLVTLSVHTFDSSKRAAAFSFDPQRSARLGLASWLGTENNGDTTRIDEAALPASNERLSSRRRINPDDGPVESA